MRRMKEMKREHVPEKYTRKTLVLQIIMTVLAGIFLLPVFIVLNYSFKSKKELYINSPISLPESLYLENYKKAFDKLDMGTTFFNTMLYTVISVLLLTLLCGITAWAIARCKSKLFNIIYIYFIVGILIPAQSLFLPIYTIGYKLNLVNTRYGIIFL